MPEVIKERVKSTLEAWVESIVLDWTVADKLAHARNRGEFEAHINSWIRDNQRGCSRGFLTLVFEGAHRAFETYTLAALELASLVRYDTSREGVSFHRLFRQAISDDVREEVLDEWVTTISGKKFSAANVRNAAAYIIANPFPNPPSVVPEPVAGKVDYLPHGGDWTRDSIVALWLSRDSDAARVWKADLRGCHNFFKAVTVIYRWAMSVQTPLPLPEKYAWDVFREVAKKYCSRFMVHEVRDCDLKEVVQTYMDTAGPDVIQLGTDRDLTVKMGDWMKAQLYPDFGIHLQAAVLVLNQRKGRVKPAETKPEAETEESNDQTELYDVKALARDGFKDSDVKDLADGFAEKCLKAGVVAEPSQMLSKYREYLRQVSFNTVSFRAAFGRYLRQNGYFRYNSDDPVTIGGSCLVEMRVWGDKFIPWVSNPTTPRTYAEWFVACKLLFKVWSVDLSGFNSVKPYQLVNYLYDNKKVPFKGHVWFTDGKPEACASGETSDTISTKAEEPMALNITTTVTMNGTPIQQLTTAQIAAQIASEERELAQLEAITHKPKRVQKDIEDRRAKLQQLVDVLDAADAPASVPAPAAAE